MTTEAKPRTHKQNGGEVEFSCNAPDAKAVYLAGDFNQWSPTAAPMRRSDEGRWTVKLKMKTGRYEFKFVIDGCWCCGPGFCDYDPFCPDCVANVFGTMNRVIEVT